MNAVAEQPDEPALIELADWPAPAGAELAWHSGLGGARLRVARWRTGVQPARGTVLLLHGFSEFIEKYLETVEGFLERGFSVVTFDWRGQGLSDRLMQSDAAAGLGRAGFVEDFEHFAFDARSVFDAFVRDEPGAKVLVGHSMGGNLALRLLEDREPVVDAAVVCAPMLGIKRLPLWFARVMTRLYLWLGKGEQYVWGGADRSLDDDADNVLTSCTRRFARNQAYLRACPDLATHAATWRWVREASVSIARVKAKSRAAQINTPTLIAAAGRDQVVSTSGYDAFAAHSAHVHVEVFEDAEHEIFQERDALRSKLWNAIETFLDRVVA